MKRFPGSLALPLLAALALTPAVSGCRRRGAAPPARQAWSVMSTLVSVSVPARNETELPRVASLARERMRELEQTLSLFVAQSEISRLNRAPAGTRIPVTGHTRRVLELALRYADLTGGAFDPTVGPLVRLWGFHGGPAPQMQPDEAAIGAAMAATGYPHVSVDSAGALLARAGMSVDLGGIAKGYAVDVVFEELLELGITDVMVNLGGNIRCTGLARDDQPWKIGVRNPFERDETIGVIRLTGGLAVATSGNYERFVTIGGERFAHIIDPRTGRPVRGVAAVTVIAPRAVDADALSTALFVLGPDKAALRSLLARAGCHALVIPDARPLRVLATPGCAALFEPDPAHADDIVVLGEGE